MGGPADDRGGETGQLWASLLDPIANARALGEVQAQALRAAGDLVERLARAVDGPEGEATDPDGNGPVPDDDREPGATGDGARLLDVWIDMLARVAQTWSRAPHDAASAANRIDLDLAVGPGGRRLVLASDGNDRTAAAGELWLHNDSQVAVGPLVPRAADLVSGVGVSLGVGWDFDPPAIDEMPARSSRGVTISATRSPDAVPGTYRGLLQIGGTPNGWIPVEVVVADREATP
jgi:hypothetical protein